MLDNIPIFLDKIGGFHDAEITSLTLDASTARLVFSLKDPLYNFEGLAHCALPDVCSLVCTGVDLSSIEIKLSDQRVMIYEIRVSADGMVNVALWAGGRIVAKCELVEVLGISETHLKSLPI
jgi:hypothetical protein